MNILKLCVLQRSIAKKSNKDFFICREGRRSSRERMFKGRKIKNSTQNRFCEEIVFLIKYSQRVFGSSRARLLSPRKLEPLIKMKIGSVLGLRIHALRSIYVRGMLAYGVELN